MHTIVPGIVVRSHLLFFPRILIENDRLKRKKGDSMTKRTRKNILEDMKTESEVFAINSKCSLWFIET